jgi:hypothetical protein
LPRNNGAANSVGSFRMDILLGFKSLTAARPDRMEHGESA